MVLKIQHVFQKNIKYEDVNNYLHSIFSNILYKFKSDKKPKYSFKIQPYKEYFKNRTYIIYINTAEIDIIKTLEDSLFKYNMKSEQLEDQKYSNIIKISNLNFELYDIILKNWDIDSKLIGSKKRIDYDSNFGLPLLKELIEVQTFLNLPSNLKRMISPTNKSKNDLDYLPFIKDIIIGEPKKVKIKDSFVISYDVIINIIDDKKSKQLAKFIVNSGVGARNSFGCGYAEYYKL